MAEKKIGGRLFRVEPLLATDAWALRFRLLQIIDETAIGKIQQGLRGLGGASDEDRAKAGMAMFSVISGILSKADPREMAGLLKDLCEIAMIQRPSKVYEPIYFDVDFQGQGREAIELAAFVIGEQFGELFPAAPARGTSRTQAGAH